MDAHRPDSADTAVSDFGRDREPLHSPHWYRVKDLRPRLSATLKVSRQVVRGEDWWVVLDPASARVLRFNQSAWSVLQRCDGQRSVQQVWHECLREQRDAAPTQGAVIRLLRQAHSAHLLVGGAGDGAGDARQLERSRQRQRKQRRRAAVNPLAFRVPLWDPDALLAAQLPVWRRLLDSPARWLPWLVLGLGAFVLAGQAPGLAAYGQQQLGNPRALLLMWLVFPLMKALHELAHALVVKLHGGEVHEIGVSLLLLTPVPYVDASASIVFDRRRARIAVAAAGIWVELLLAALALLGWAVVEDGLVREACFAVVAVGLLSTLLVNANPLLRFDGYHVLTEALGLPNLAPRSSRRWQLLAQRALGFRHAGFGPVARGENGWLLAYAPLAYVYRSALFFGLAFLAAPSSTLLGLALLGLALWTSIGQPVFKAGKWLLQAPEAAGRRGRAALAATGALAAAALLVALLPLPLRSHAPGVVWLPDEALLRSATDGRLDALLVEDGAWVETGTALLRLSNEPLQANLERVASAIERLTVEEGLGFAYDTVKRERAAEELVRLRAEQARLATQVESLTLRAGVAGRVALDGVQRDLGRWLPQGQPLGLVLPPGAPIVRALVRNEDIALVRGRAAAGAAVHVELAGAPGMQLVAASAGAVPLATLELPSAALGDAAGGPIAIDPADSRGLTMREARFQVDLALAPGSRAAIGTRALVTFEHGSVSAAALALRGLRGLLLRHFET